MLEVLDEKMAKKKDDKPAKKATASTKVDAEILRRAKTVAAQRGIDLYDYLDEVLEERVNADYKVAAARMQQEGQ